MDTTVMKPMTMAELLPELGGILTLEARQTLTAKKQPRPKIPATRTSEKVMKPLTIAEMRADIEALRVQSPKRNAGDASNKKKWNSSVKLDKKTINHTANGQMKHNSVRKVLNFQPPKPRPPKMSMMPNSRPTLMNSETPKFPKPEIKVKKSLHSQARNNVRISGVYQIPETPVYKVPKSRMTIANKENITTNYNQQVTKKLAITPKPELPKIVVTTPIPDTPMSYASSNDDSFLLNEKEIDFIENRNKALTEENNLENITEVSASTPFKEHRNVTEFFNNSSAMEDSNASNDDTIMCFDTQSKSNENGKREESVIVSLCDLLNKATVSNTNKPNSELDELLEVEKQTENNIKLIEKGIKTLENIKQSHLKSLQYVRKLIQEKKEKQSHTSESDKTVIETKDSHKNTSLNDTLVVNNPTSVTRKSGYKIPKKNPCLRKKVFHKSVPEVSNITPQKDMGHKAFNMYMKMKEHMQFLSTPSVKQRTEVPDTPGITSHNLQKQLDKLYTQS